MFSATSTRLLLITHGIINPQLLFAKEEPKAPAPRLSGKKRPPQPEGDEETASENEEVDALDSDFVDEDEDERVGGALKMGMDVDAAETAKLDVNSPTFYADLVQATVNRLNFVFEVYKSRSIEVPAKGSTGYIRRFNDVRLPLPSPPLTPS